MTRFFFDTIDTGRAAQDDDGTELPSLEVAKREASPPLARSPTTNYRTVTPESSPSKFATAMAESRCSGQHFPCV
jgi:hypothetical protein